MNAYRYETLVPENGVIALPLEPVFYNMEVEIIVLPKQQAAPKRCNAKEFLNKWSGAFKEMTDEESDDARYEYLTKKHA